MRSARRLRDVISALGVMTLIAVGALSAVSCGGQQSVALIGGQHVDPARIDSDPLALLPGGIIVLSYLDAAAMFQSRWGPDAARLTANLLPLGPEANFVPERDVVRIYGGVYAMQGADYCAVVQGNFDVDAIQRTADGRAITILSAPLVKTRYAGNDLFTAGNVGFVVLTAHTALVGNETGMRRALDRLRYGKLERAIPQWMIDLIATPGATIVAAGDGVSEGAAAALASRLPFLAGLRAARVIGNFLPPGLNFAASLSYGDERSAQGAASSIRSFQQLSMVANLLSAFGLGVSVPPMQIAQQGSDVQVTVPMDDAFIRTLFGLAARASQYAATSSNRAPGTVAPGQ